MMKRRCVVSYFDPCFLALALVSINTHAKAKAVVKGDFFSGVCVAADIVYSGLNCLKSFHNWEILSNFVVLNDFCPGQVCEDERPGLSFIRGLTPFV